MQIEISKIFLSLLRGCQTHRPFRKLNLIPHSSLKETRFDGSQNLWWILNKTIMEIGNITKAATFKSFLHLTYKNTQLLVFVTVLLNYFHEANIKGCVRYIFTSLFCMCKREYFRKKEKCFLFHFESSLHSWDNQFLSFQIFKCHDVIKCLTMKHETQFTE